MIFFVQRDKRVFETYMKMRAEMGPNVYENWHYLPKNGSNDLNIIQQLGFDSF